ncbi:MAG: peptidoglycan glycosyltransferase [Acidobacteriales bacterium]|nr:peptidoglycan glycosyltransferase [Terriglobales bacterium]
MQQIGREEKVPTSKLLVVQYAILAIFLLLAFGLWRLQVMRSEQYESLAEKNRIRTIPILAPRGKILDREGRIIVDNYPSFSALLLREQPHEVEPKISKIADGLNVSADEIRNLLRRYAGRPKYEPVVIKQDITPDELAFIEANKSEIPELETIMVHRRLYPKDGFAAHLIGYVGEVSEDDLNRPQFELYKQGDIVGKSGLEQQYNDLLIGKDGERRALVDSKGKEVGRLSKTPAEPGKQLKLTIDLDIQIAAEEALEGHNGAMIAMDPRNGDILALVSRPTFDPNHFAVRISRDEWNKLVTDPAKPLLNKAIQAQLAPGSVFKIIMSVAGWQEGIAQTLNVHCNGGATFYGRRFGCWVKGGHGAVDLTKAIYQSCDVFFYTLAERLGISRIAKYATALGLGQKTGVDLPQEASGIMPSEEWKIRNFKQKWFAGETISVGIGQGAVTTTPMQLMRAIAAISMDGQMVMPHVVNPTDMPKGYTGVSRPEVKNVAIDAGGWNVITDAMGRVLLPEGTAPSAHVPGVDIAGKTGSAQVVSLALRAKHEKNDDFAQNGWFVGFTPRRNPEIIVAVLFEGGEHGKLAARLATQVIKAYADKQRRIGVKTAGVTKDGKAIEVAGLWNQRDEHADKDATPDAIQGGRFKVALSAKRSTVKPPAILGTVVHPFPAGQD